MTQPMVINDEPITMVELREELARIEKRDKEPSFRVGRTTEYLNAFVQLSPQKAEEFKKRILELNIPRIKDEHIDKIIDVMPASVEELKSVLMGYMITVNNENIKKIMNAVGGFTSEKK
ncbi:TPA: hypothetical protein HA317_02450 [Candidatus Woesearchaeota archaeon]|nr:hypothetical protein [Candidatus Woesearchaeota archaeon]